MAPTPTRRARQESIVTIRVLLVDDQALVRSGFRMLIESSDDIDVVGEAGDGEQALAFMETAPVDVVLMDIRMPGMDGIEATRRIVASNSPANVLVLTTFDDDEYVYSALRAGASGFLLKDSRPQDLLQAIRSVASGDAVMAPSATRRLLTRMIPLLPKPGSDKVDSPLDVLTDREREVLIEIAKGATNAEISASLYMAEGTVKTHIGRLFTKLRARDRVQLVLIAYEVGLVSP